MFGGGGGFDPRKMEQMMQQMGIDMDELDAEEVVIKTADAEYVFDAPEVTKMDARGQATYTVVGEPEERERGAGGDASAIEAGDGTADEDDGIPDADVEMVQTRTGASEAAAREALEENDGDLAAAVAQLE
ncbi:nascent polypeptide-associated complex protein [Salinarchaeum laminariae]|uniref:nascent polypeptide-associated complex protein n=1 Tax=Salinarchaeum laminariae TaxID=869888 RepID=UPI0020C18067|nr:nascent polypeptide-associated complex protein [Salinarchaeum laminariae]